VDKNETTELLRHAAQRASRHPFFMAANLEDFRIRHGMEEANVARFLDCAPELLAKLALCRRPDPGSPQFRSDVRRIAEALGLNSQRLVQLIREAEALKALGESSQFTEQENSPGILMAARDTETDEHLSEPDQGEHHKKSEEGS
jgi:hypothetical protein